MPKTSSRQQSRRRKSKPATSCAQPPQAPLSPEALRLLQGLAAEGAYAVADPIEAGRLILRGGAAVSLGKGRFGVAAADELVDRDLAVRGTGASGRPLYQASSAGLAYRRRAAARCPEEAFAEQHRSLAEAEIGIGGEVARVRVNTAESALDWLARRKDADGAPLIDAAQHAAGERLRRDLTLAGMLPSVSARWDAAPPGGQGRGPRDPAGATDGMIAARQRAARALATVGPDFADLLIDLCGFLKGLAEIERDRGWPPRSGKVVVRLALGRLAEHYGYGRIAEGPHRSRIRAWTEAVPPSGPEAPTPQ